MSGTSDGTLPEPLQLILTDSERTPAGRSFYPVDDLIMREAARSLAPQLGYYVVDIHGTADRAKVGPHWLDADQLATLIRAAPEWDGQDVFLMSCDSGRHRDGFAQQVADRLRVDVAAPDKLAWSDFEESGFAQPYSSDGYLDGTGVPHPVKPPTGSFVTFSPSAAAADTGADERSAELTGGPRRDRARRDETALGLLHRQGTTNATTPIGGDLARPSVPAGRGNAAVGRRMSDQLRGG